MPTGLGAGEGPERALRLALLGDSITAGARVEALTESYPAVLGQLLGQGYEVRSFGLGGATLLRSGTPNVWSKLEAVAAFEPDGVLIMLGTNDTVDGDRGNWSRIGRFQSDASDLVQHLLELPSSPFVFLAGPTAMVLQTPELKPERLANLTERQPRLEQLRAVLERVVHDLREPRLRFLDLGPVLRDHPGRVIAGDGVHPNRLGHQALAEAVAAALPLASPDQWRPLRTDDWHGYERHHYTIEGRDAWVVVPEKSAPRRPWIWRARFPFFHAEMDHELLGHGYHIAYVDVAQLYGNHEAMALGESLYQWLVKEHHFNPKPVLEGVSRGGLFVYQWAGLHPDQVAAIYADTPVCEPRSWPGGLGSGRGSAADWSRLLDAHGMTEAKTTPKDYPVLRHASTLAGQRLPILHIISEDDIIVPPHENTLLWQQALQRHGHDLDLIRVPSGTKASGGHHFQHPEPDRVIRFILKHGNPCLP